jgi:hypothetical protein
LYCPAFQSWAKEEGAYNTHNMVHISFGCDRRSFQLYVASDRRGANCIQVPNLKQERRACLGIYNNRVIISVDRSSLIKKTKEFQSAASSEAGLDDEYINLSDFHIPPNGAPLSTLA